MSNRNVFFLILAISLVSFLPSIGAGFVYDYLGWQKEYEQGTFADIINCFGYKGNHQFLHFVFYSFYKIFNIAGLPWYLFFTSLHAVNGYLLYRFMLQLSDYWKVNIPQIIALGATFIFLLHPYSVEPVVWRVCVHYLISMMQVMLVLILYLSYLQTGNRQHLYIGGLIYLVSLFTLEVSFITPVVLGLAGLLIWWTGENKRSIFKSTFYYGGMLFGLLGGYLLLNKITLGNVVGHYGAQVHLRLDFLTMAATEFKYLVKHLFFARLYSYNAKGLLFDKILSMPAVTFFITTLIISISVLYFIKIKKLHPKWHLAFFGLMASILFVMPVSNIYFFHLHYGMNDRYSYIPIAFLVISVAALAAYGKKWISYSILALLLLISIYWQQRILSYWNQSTQVLQALKEKFIWHDAPYVFILNSPDNFHGTVMASILDEPSGIDELLDYQTARPYNGKMFDVFQYNMTLITDGAHVEQTGPMQIKVTFNQWGNWWHRNGIGAGTYENEYYKAELLDHPYLLTFKQFPEGSVIIYQDGKEWKEFKFSG